MTVRRCDASSPPATTNSRRSPFREIFAAPFYERKPEMSWYFYVLEFVSGLLLTNGVPHFVEVVSGHRFQPPFGYPPGIGESSLLVTPFGDLQIWQRIHSSLV